MIIPILSRSSRVAWRVVLCRADRVARLRPVPPCRGCRATARRVAGAVGEEGTNASDPRAEVLALASARGSIHVLKQLYKCSPQLGYASGSIRCGIGSIDEKRHFPSRSCCDPGYIRRAAREMAGRLCSGDRLRSGDLQRDEFLAQSPTNDVLALGDQHGRVRRQASVSAGFYALLCDVTA